jgi:HNH endonuclease
MRRIHKSDNSKIIIENLNYTEGNSNNNLKISKILYKEQKGFCAYTEEYIGRADAKDIEHFNPKLKNTADDSYLNWFLVKHQWNNEKSTKWENFQPVLNPTDSTFENRISYDNGDYRVVDSNDTEAVNLIRLIKLDDLILADERKKYIRRKTDEIEKFGVSNQDFFKILIEDNIKQISYLRAIQEEFKINIWEMLPEPQ